jgi:uncharacterized protein (TIGR03086 family)
MVLAAVVPDQLDAGTPCADWKVSDLINHIVGGQGSLRAACLAPPVRGEADFSSDDYVAAFDEVSHACLDAFNAEGVMDKVLSLPFGEMPGHGSSGSLPPTRSPTAGTSPRRPAN